MGGEVGGAQIHDVLHFHLHKDEVMRYRPVEPPSPKTKLIKR